MRGAGHRRLFCGPLSVLALHEVPHLLKIQLHVVAHKRVAKHLWRAGSEDIGDAGSQSAEPALRPSDS